MLNPIVLIIGNVLSRKRLAWFASGPRRKLAMYGVRISFSVLLVLK